MEHYRKAIYAITEHQAAFLETYGAAPAIIHLNPFLIACLADSPWIVHFDKEKWIHEREGYFAPSRLLPADDLPMTIMWSPREFAPDWSGEH